MLVDRRFFSAFPIGENFIRPSILTPESFPSAQSSRSMYMVQLRSTTGFTCQRCGFLLVEVDRRLNAADIVAVEAAASAFQWSSSREFR